MVVFDRTCVESLTFDFADIRTRGRVVVGVAKGVAEGLIFKSCKGSGVRWRSVDGAEMLSVISPRRFGFQS